jgi:hypothetical protein
MHNYPHGKTNIVWLGILFVTFLPLLKPNVATQTAATFTPSPAASFFSPTNGRAPCDGESTRTPTPTASIVPTDDPRSPTPTVTSTHYPLFASIPLIWPPNCAVLHSNVLPDFQFETQLIGPFTVTLYLRGPANRMIAYGGLIGNSPLASSTPDYLPEGDYYWQVTSVKFDNLAGQSETWVFRIDTSCRCTDTPTP